MLGLYDSGVGGLTVYNEIQKVMPGLECVYLADTAHLPLGAKTQDELRTIVTSAILALFELGCDLIVLACNTATVNTIRYIQQIWLPEHYPHQNKQVLGISKPFTEYINLTFSKEMKQSPGLLLATQATISSDFYQAEFIQLGLSHLYPLKCSGLADAIETCETSVIKNVFEQNIATLPHQRNTIKYLLLACTHYPIAQSILQTYFLSDTVIINPALPVAKKLKIYYKKHPEFNKSFGISRFYTTTKDCKDLTQTVFPNFFN